MSFPSNPQPSSNPHSTTARVGHLLPEFSFNLWDHFHQDISSSTPTTTLHPYPISHLDQLSNTNTLDFPSNLPSLWAYQTLLGFTPNQFNPYSTYPPLQSTTTLYTHLNQPPSTLPPPNQTLSSSNPSIPYHPLPSPITPLPHQNIGDDPPNRSSPASSFKMFKCTLDPNCEMEFTRAEHLARHERKHTKEKPFKCHCTKSFSRLDNWRQHKLSVHKEDAQQNALTEERLVQVHKSMQRQNNIRKAATMASQNHDRFQRCPSITGSSESTTYSPAPSSFSDPSLAPHPSYPPHSHPLSPLPTQTPDRTLSNPFTNPLGIIPNSNPSLLIPLTTPINTPAQHKPNSEQTTDHFSRQYSPRLINYNQISRAPLSSLWPIFQQQQQPSSSSSSSTSTTSSSYYPNSPCQSNFRHQTSAPITQSSDQAAAGLLFKMNDQLVSHHLQFLSSLTHEQTTTLTPRKAAPGILRNGDLGYVENQRAYASYLLVGQNTPDSGSRKRPLATDDGLEAGSNGQANEPNFVKKIRI